MYFAEDSTLYKAAFLNVNINLALTKLKSATSRY
jgi:hypothetical protein